MNKVHIAPEARSDLKGIREYIRDELQNPAAAAKTVSSILKRLRTLEGFAEAGASLSNIVGFDTVYRYLVCGSYLAFYQTHGKNVFVDRILYGRRDYARILFGEYVEN